MPPSLNEVPIPIPMAGSNYIEIGFSTFIWKLLDHKNIICCWMQKKEGYVLFWWSEEDLTDIHATSRHGQTLTLLIEPYISTSFSEIFPYLGWDALPPSKGKVLWEQGWDLVEPVISYISNEQYLCLRSELELSVS